MTINVTQKHIDKGIKGAFTCPVNLAVRDKLSIKDNSVKVCWTAIFVGTIRYPIHADVTTFIRKFDNGDKVEPFSFEVEL